MDVAFLTPEAAFVGALALAPLAAAAVAARRGERVRRVLGLPRPRRVGSLGPLAALVLLGVLLGLAAAQPVLSSTEERPVRTDAEALFLIDNSRSMLATSGRDAPTRFTRGRELAARLRDAIPAVPVGIASLTDRAVPHLLPTPDATTFRNVLERSLAIERPPPVNVADRITTFDPLYDVGTTNFFSVGARRRVIVVITDGEADEANVFNIRRGIPLEAGYRVMFVQVWDADEVIYRPNGTLETEYRPDPRSVRSLARLGRVLQAPVFHESEGEEAAAELRRLVGRGRTTVRAQREERVALTPWLVGAALVPLGLVLVSRNRP
jgi:hypothetical protein